MEYIYLRSGESSFPMQFHGHLDCLLYRIVLNGTVKKLLIGEGRRRSYGAGASVVSSSDDPGTTSLPRFSAGVRRVAVRRIAPHIYPSTNTCLWFTLGSWQSSHGFVPHGIEYSPYHVEGLISVKVKSVLTARQIQTLSILWRLRCYWKGPKAIYIGVVFK